MLDRVSNITTRCPDDTGGGPWCDQDDLGPRYRYQAGELMMVDLQSVPPRKQGRLGVVEFLMYVGLLTLIF